MLCPSLLFQIGANGENSNQNQKKALSPTDMAFSRVFRRRLPSLVTIIVLICTVYFLCLYRNWLPDELNIFLSLEYQALEEGRETTEFTDGKCVLPKLDPFRAEIMPLIETLPPLKCREKRYGVVEGQEIHLNTKGIKSAKMVYIRRPHDDDFSVEYSDPIKIDLNEKGMDLHKFNQKNHRLLL